MLLLVQDGRREQGAAEAGAHQAARGHRAHRGALSGVRLHRRIPAARYHTLYQESPIE